MCILCVINKQLVEEEQAAAMGNMDSGQETVDLVEAHERAQINLMRSTAIQKMVKSIRDLEDMNLQDLSMSVRRMLERMLPSEPIPEPPSPPVDTLTPNEVEVAKLIRSRLFKVLSDLPTYGGYRELTIEQLDARLADEIEKFNRSVGLR